MTYLLKQWSEPCEYNYHFDSLSQTSNNSLNADSLQSILPTEVQHFNPNNNNYNNCNNYYDNSSRNTIPNRSNSSLKDKKIQLVMKCEASGSHVFEWSIRSKSSFPKDERENPVKGEHPDTQRELNVSLFHNKKKGSHNDKHRNACQHYIYNDKSTFLKISQGAETLLFTQIGTQCVTEQGKTWDLEWQTDPELSLSKFQISSNRKYLCFTVKKENSSSAQGFFFPSSYYPQIFYFQLLYLLFCSHSKSSFNVLIFFFLRN